MCTWCMKTRNDLILKQAIRNDNCALIFVNWNRKISGATMRRVRWVGHVARMCEEWGVYRVLVGKPEGRRLLGRPRRRWVDNIEWIFRRWDVDMWTGLGWPRVETGGGRLRVR